MSKRNRPRHPARRDAYKDVKPLILVVTEGKYSEPEYLKGLFHAAQNPRVKIRVIEAAGVPVTLTRRAAEEKLQAETEAKSERDENRAYDQVWCVFDIDEHPHINEAIQFADENHLALAVSNPCFELWLLLHFTDPPGIQNRAAIASRLKRYLPEYKKHVNFAHFAQGLQDALKRAKTLSEGAAEMGETYRNPTTGVWRLANSILES